MRDRNEKTPQTISPDVTPIPIGLVPLIKVLKVRKVSYNANVFKLGIHTETVMAWKPKELHRFWKEMIK